MELVTVIANERSTTEARVVNDYTVRQIAHIGATILKDRLLVLSSVARSLSSFSPAEPQGREKPAGKRSRGKRVGLPEWYRRRNPRARGGMVVDLDGPLEELAPFVGGIGNRRKPRR